MSRLKIVGVLIGFLSFVPLAGRALPPASSPPSSVPQIKILSDVSLPLELNSAADVRWSGDQSVLLALRRNGVAEFHLTPGGKIEEIFPGAAKIGGLRLATLVAASSRYVVAPTLLSLVWKLRSAPSHMEVAFELAKAVDVKDDQVLVIGLRRDEGGEIASDGAIAWRGSLE